LVALSYLAAYVLLDFVSFIFPLSPMGITPWNPQTGLSFALILLKGRGYIPLLFLAPALSSLLVHRLPSPLWVDVLAVAVIGGGYAAATLVLLRPRVRFDPTLSSLTDLTVLLVMAAISCGAVAFAYSFVFVLAGWLTWGELPSAVLHHWVGDAIGVYVVTPFVLSAFTVARLPRPAIELAILLAAIACALWVIFGFAGAWEFQFFYLLFLPVIWVATRFGLEGASVALFVAQAGLIVAMDWTDQSVADVAKFQLLMLVLALTGLFLGVAISAQRRGLTRLHLHQEALARATRLTSLSALAATLAHEVNQPLTALGNYVRMLRDMIQSGEGNTPVALDTSQKAIAQVDHAARLVRNLREFVRTGAGEVVPTPPTLLIAETLQLARPILENANVQVDVVVKTELAPVLVDRLQIEQVLLNIISNSVEAIASAGRTTGRIEITAAPCEQRGFLEFRLLDDGPGFPPGFPGSVPSFATTKLQGTGVGLTLSHSIVERHGGRLTLSNSSRQGALVAVRLPTAQEAPHAD
jgi:signal transduction histidine kinase